MTVIPPEIAGRLDSRARRALAEALAQAQLGQQSEVSPLHVLAALLPGCEELRILVERQAVDPRLLLSFAEVSLARKRRIPSGLNPVLDDRLTTELSLLGIRRGRLLGPAELAEAALRSGSPELERVLAEFNLKPFDLAAALEAGVSPAGAAIPARSARAADVAAGTPLAPDAAPPPPATASQRPKGPSLALDLGFAAPPLPWTVALRASPDRPTLVGRAGEVATILAVLRQRTVRSPLLVGPAGVGRRTVLAEVLARLSGVGVGLPTLPVALDLVALLAGTRARGDLEDRMTKLADALREDADRVLLCIPDASMLEAAMTGVGLDEILADLAERHGLRLAVIATPDDVERLRTQGRRLAEVLEQVAVEEPGAEDLGAILAGHGEALARHHGLAIAEAARTAARDLAGRYLREPALPARAIRLLDAAAARVAARGGREVGADDVAETVGAWTRIPVQRLVRGESDRLRALDDTLRRSIKGQDDAIARVARAVRRGRLGLRDPRRPIGSFLFAGPTGVGKTELARKLAEALFDDPQSLIRIDMSEFREPHMVARLLGAPPGYKDSESGGVLTEAIKRRPYSVLLLDEMEKAHGDVHNILLQLLDDGRLTDARGRSFDFTHCVVAMTTNVGGRLGLQAKPDEDVDTPMREALLGTFRPELLNRIDEIVVFRALGEDALRAIARLALDDAATLARPLGATVEFSPAVDAWVVGRRDAPEFGARPVRRVVRREVLDLLAQLVLDGTAASGDRIAFDVVEGKLAWKVERPAGAGAVPTPPAPPVKPAGEPGAA
ncbi:MAG: ATP-dependent Clp protease ATP-binding subunit [Deltaproteobacteria bacterium]|nr:ATP-dependent Clp protease ATP-binding subunit [Deltaproteobacteria bacterium]